jgi:RNA polymerase sigma-70 factor (ECF subfamily)
MTPNRGSDEELVVSAAAGDGEAMGELFVRHRPRLRAMLQVRLDQRLQGRVDPSDVLQETFAEASQRLAEYARRPSMPFFLWLRFLTVQQLLQHHRRHLGTQKRSAEQERAAAGAVGPDASAMSLAEQVVGTMTSPSLVAARSETAARLAAALEEMDAIDREVIVLRHFEELTNQEAAEVLGISKAACSKRYVRALGRLQEIIGSIEDELG